MAIAPISSITRYADAAQAEIERTSTLGQDDFLKLMTTQLMNQDPLSPMENGEFLAQMAQFSTVNGITEMNTSIQSMADSFTSQRLMQASAMINKSALVEGSFASLDQEKGLRGAYVLDQATDGTQVVIRNLNGEIVHVEQLGIQFPGTHEFMWDGEMENGLTADPGQYLVQVNALENGEVYSPTTLVYANVNAISTDASGELVLEVAGIGNTPFNNVYRIAQ
jgi:flagellar basal-body rod modification protein FlgD